MTPEEKVQNVVDQVAAIRAGQRTQLDCPYCDTHNRRGEMCCRLLYRAAEVALEGIEDREQQDMAEMIAEKAYVH